VVDSYFHSDIITQLQATVSVHMHKTVLLVLTWSSPSPIASGLDDLDADGEGKSAIFSSLLRPEFLWNLKSRRGGTVPGDQSGRSLEPLMSKSKIRGASFVFTNNCPC
jgi:hypothetical protein